MIEIKAKLVRITEMRTRNLFVMKNVKSLSANSHCLPFAFLLLLISLHSPVSAQESDIYSLRWKREPPVLGTAGITNATGFLLNFFKDPLTEEQISNLDKQNVWEFDRSATNNYSENFALASDIGVISSLATPVALVADPVIRQDWKQITLLYAEALLVTNGLTTLTKPIAKRKRPYTYNNSAPLAIKLEKDATSSFFSGHTSLAATGAFFAAKVYSDYHPDSPAKPYVWTVAAILPAATGYFRYEAGEHFPTDIVAGYVVGGSVGILIPEIHKAMEQENGNSQANRIRY